MIAFFRKIRQKTLPGNKFSQYMLYAIGEIILVVVGILIALSINNWNEARKESKAEEEFIRSIKNDLKQDKDFILLIVDILAPKIAAYQTLENDLTHLYLNDRDSLETVLHVYFKSQRTFYPISGSYESAIAGNQITAFSNRALIRKVIQLYNSTYNRLIDNGQILDVRWAFVSKKYSYERRTGKSRDMTPDQLSELLDDLYHHCKQMAYYQDQLKSTLIEIDGIIEGD